ncbi:MAG: Phenylpropionate dioxygenase [Labilithrix sp.]|nr:Phenylpropionate dioxygenase [Labilithrix sp.]
MGLSSSPAPAPPSWRCVGRVEDVPGPGSFFTVPLTPAGVLVARDAAGALHAFHAVCTHRGTAFLPDGAAGACARFTCPYHGFQFELDGRACANVPDLAPVRLAVAHGFVFVTLEADAPPLEDVLGEVPPWLLRADLDRLVRAHHVTYEIAARLSVVLENFQESLHFTSTHPALEALTPSARAETWTPGDDGPWRGGIMPLVDAAETVSLSGTRQGRPWLVPDEDRRVVHDAMRFPDLLTSLQPDYLLVFVLVATGEAKTRVTASIYLHEDAPAGSADDVSGFWARVHEEDRLACERQERGLRSVEMRARYTDVEEGAALVAALARRSAVPPMRPPQRLAGIFGQPYADLSELIDTSALPDLHAEITRGLATVETGYTGGTLKWMGVCAPWVERDGYRDAMEAVRAMSTEERRELLLLGDDPGADADDPDLVLGDETDHPFSGAQQRFLEQRHGVYFPWKVCYHLLENERWDDKHSGRGKDFSDEARAVFPRTVAFVESLPFREIGRAVVFGLLANDHAPAHRDSEPGKALAIAQSISFEPSRAVPGARHKRFYLATPDGREEVVVDAPVYWFNDMDWHGVHADPFFRYSVRVDGVFEPRFLEEVRRVTTNRSRRGPAR